ncbi:hypothetical protein SAMN05216226_102154 [Halovenus aranensis]|uniref:Uncharacterized protein n=2 Tax=Halovenus aranensis TaxID=890420 RepID=A0A1G8SWK1_9EURY|nr:hypothetical protein SAMN05216226_102154 [Halovenus aranensis]
MSHSESQHSTATTESPYARDNYWGSLDQDNDDEQGHVETSGTDPAQYLAYQYLSDVVDVVCGRTLDRHDREIELSEPCLYLPKESRRELGVARDGTPDTCPACDNDHLQRVAPLRLECTADDCDESILEDRTLRVIEYRQHRHRRRINPETGWINWGESTSTDVPDEIDEDVWLLAVHNYLAQSELRYSLVDGALTYAERLYRDPNQSTAQDALATFIEMTRRVCDPEADVGSFPA